MVIQAWTRSATILGQAVACKQCSVVTNGPQESIRHTISLILTKTETFLCVFFVVVVVVILMLLMKNSDLTTRMLQKTLSSGQPVFFQPSIVQLDTQCGILLPYPFCLQGSTRLCIQSCSSAYAGCNKC